MKKYRYVVACSNGATHDMNRDETFFPQGLGATVRFDLPELLRKGWMPVRETAMGGPGSAMVAYSLILLEKEVAESA